MSNASTDDSAPPGAGKGTQGTLIAAHFGIPRISTGELLRDHVARRTGLGQAVQAYLNRGELVPDQVVLDMLREAMVATKAAGGGYVLDGIPRNMRQARAAYLIGRELEMTADVEFLRSVPGIGPGDQSIWSDEELRSYAVAEAGYFARYQVRVAVTGWTLTALLSTRLAGIPLVTEHAGSFLPPVFERGLLPAPSGPVGLPRRALPAQSGAAVDPERRARQARRLHGRL